MCSTLPSSCDKVTGILSLYMHFTDKKTEVQREKIALPVIFRATCPENCVGDLGKELSVLIQHLECKAPERIQEINGVEMIEPPIASFHIYPGWGIKEKSGKHYRYQTTSSFPD